MLFSEINYPKLEIIAGTECIGDSLYKINANTINLSSYVVGMQSDISQTWYQLQNDIVGATSVLARVQALSAQTTQWDSVYTFVQQSSSYIYDGYNLALSAIPKTALLSALRGNQAYFTSVSATQITAVNLNTTNTYTNYLSSRSSQFNSLTATGFYYGDGSRLTGIVAPTRVYARFRGATLNLPDQSLLPSGYLGTNYNVSSVAKTGTGTYQVNFARSIESPDYAYFVCSGGGNVPYVACRAPDTNASTTSITVVNKRLQDNVSVDAEEMSVLVLYPQSN